MPMLTRPDTNISESCFRTEYFRTRKYSQLVAFLSSYSVSSVCINKNFVMIAPKQSSTKIPCILNLHFTLWTLYTRTKGQADLRGSGNGEH
jgi:hypothetical protein